MLRHYLAVALVAHRRQPVASLLGIATLALGLTCFLGAYGVAGYWQRADRHFANAERAFVVTSEWRAREVRAGTDFRSGVVPGTHPLLAEHLRADLPALDAVARIGPFQTQSYQAATAVRADDRTVPLQARAADAALFEIFDFALVEGDASAALRSPASIVLTQAAAERLFGREPALGRTVVLADRWNVTVTGVLAPIPEPSQFGAAAGAPLFFDMLVSWDLFEPAARVLFGNAADQVLRNWVDQSTVTYVLLPRDGSLSRARLRSFLTAFPERHIPPEQRAAMLFELDLVRASDVLAKAVDQSMSLHRSGFSAAAVLLLLGALVLAVACVNFANLATARAVRRAREVGVRKSLGADLRQVLAQHLLETGVLAAAALAVSLALLASAAPMLERAVGIDVRLALFDGAGAWLTLGAVLVGVTLAAGVYPAVVLARLPVSSVLHSGRTRTGAGSIGSLLIGAQFAVAAFLLLAVAVIFAQNRHLERAALALTDAPLLVIHNDPEATGLAHATLRAELSALPQISAVTQLATAPWTRPSGTMPLTVSAEDQAIARTALLHIVGADFFETFDIDLLAGRLFDPARAEDTAPVGQGPATWTQSMVVSRALAQDLGFASPAEAVDRLVYMPGARANRIIGVVEDKPINIATDTGARRGVYLFNPNTRYHVVKVDPRDVDGAVAAVDALWRRLVPNVAPNRRFAAEYFDEAYAQFVRLNGVFTALAITAAAIAATGLFAMALLAVGRRVQEIGVRKTLGASEGQVVRMLLASFTLPVVVANVIAWPAAYVAARKYLDLFVAPIELTWLPFAACLGATVLVACVAVVGQSWRAARLQPARVLRHE